ncbi:hypothetical protein Ocin01_02474, partial [Orchesella cincta]
FFFLGALVLCSMCFVICRKRRTRITSYGFFQQNSSYIFEDEDEKLFEIPKTNIIEKKFRIDTDEDSDADESVDGDELLSAGMRQWTRT